MQLSGLHHVSALTANARRNVDFYTRVLGMRLVKKTVNQDNPTSYHLFYGDEIGRAGTEFTFFYIAHMAPTRAGHGSISRTGLRVRGREALQFWAERLREEGVEPDPIRQEGARAVLAFRDFEGQHVALIDDSGAAVAGGAPWPESSVPPEVGIRGLASVTLTVARAAPTVRVLTGVMGFREQERFVAADHEGEVVIYRTGEGGPGAEVRVVQRPELERERLGRGGVHHVAFRVPDDEQLAAWVQRLADAGLRNTGVIDRYYFKSVYFREPNKILFELATDGPGFTIDEDEAHLGQSLALPPFLEPQRERIEAALEPL